VSASVESITLRAMRFHARVGILPHEQELAQPLEIDLTVRLGPGREVVDYRGLYDDAASVVGAGPLLYLEEIADAVATRALSRARVLHARVAVRKPHVGLGGPLDYAEVVVERGELGSA
jgi:7,8-dihydroneopterin aldolase/epimerase/oxygenase